MNVWIILLIVSLAITVVDWIIILLLSQATMARYEKIYGEKIGKYQSRAETAFGLLKVIIINIIPIVNLVELIGLLVTDTDEAIDKCLKEILEKKVKWEMINEVANT